jgi:FkbM family methyltransferase
MHKVVNGRWGPVAFYGKDEYVGKSLFNYGEYNPDETEKIIELATPGKLCLDVGANVGVITQALEFSGFEVIGFEPQPKIFELLRLNTRGTSYNVALGTNTGMVKMPRVQYAARGNFGGLSIGTSSLSGTIDVAITTLDSYNFENVGLIKIDVEGFEEQVLRGGTKTILASKPVLYIEDDRQEKRMGLRNYIRELGYSIEMHQPPLYREKNFFDKRKNVWDRNYASHNLICKPC